MVLDKVRTRRGGSRAHSSGRASPHDWSRSSLVGDVYARARSPVGECTFFSTSIGTSVIRCVLLTLWAEYGLLQSKHLNQTPRWIDWMCLGMFIHFKVSEHPIHRHWTACRCARLWLRVRRCKLMDLTKPSSGREQCNPPGGPQVGAGTAKGPARKLDISTPSADTCAIVLI